MGYSEAEASIAMERCGLDSSIAELAYFICAAQMAKAADALLPRKLEKKLLNEDDHAVHLSNLMIGFGVPTESDQITQITLPEDAIGLLYCYYENVALAPVGAWTEMSRSAKLKERTRKTLEAYGNEPPSSVQKYVLDECRESGLGSVRDMFPGDINVLSLFSRISDAKVTFYCLGISLKIDADCLFCCSKILTAISHSSQTLESQQSSEGHNGYNPDKENDRHGRGINDVSRSEPVSRYNQSASDDLFIPIIHLNGTYDFVIGESARDMD
ncbi:DEAD-box ATP-dependent RNA helicase 46 isoform 1 [Hibiscus syriacus]|uniref:DEAD-box ATP-dependent RNA helicase 46 isoform 1 n=1 Tax=Hibiscus syriacus TaxID=106335 RepID=A0A6A2YEC4_HIBSY|nr:DEAD-box ATP-dependent RNA helicase 46 isoform 1 [Hibiscus syriacus]